jgi:hypothetical protein
MTPTPEKLATLERAIVDFSRVAAALRPYFLQSPEIEEVVGAGIQLALKLLTALTENPPGYLADQLVTMQSVLRRAELPTADPHAEPSFALAAAREGMTRLLSHLDLCIEAADAVGFEPSVVDRNLDRHFVARQFVRKAWLESLSERFGRVEMQLEALNVASRKPLALSEFDARMLRYLTSNVEVGVDLARYEIERSTILDLSNLTTAARNVAESAEAFSATLEGIDGTSLTTLRRPASLLHAAAARALRGTSAIVHGHSRGIDRGALFAGAARDATAGAVAARVDPELIADALAAGKSLEGFAIDTIEWLDLAFRGLRDIEPLRALRGLRALKLAMNPLAEIDPLEALTNLAELDLSVTNVSELKSLASLLRLKELSLSGSWAKDLRPLERLAGLISLDLSRTQVKDLRIARQSGWERRVNPDETRQP